MKTATAIFALTFGGCAIAIAGDLENDAAECKRLGFVKGTDSFLQCLQLAAVIMSELSSRGPSRASRSRGGEERG